MIIVKVGGSKNLNWDEIALDLKSVMKKEKVVLVHGANQIREEIAKKIGFEVKTVMSPSGFPSVFTDKEAMDLFMMTYAGLVNKRIVEALQRNGINAIGLSGIDGRIWEGKLKAQILVKADNKVKVLRGNLTGKIEKVNSNLINLLLDNNYLPVLTPPAISSEGVAFNVDNDVAIVEMAKSLNSAKGGSASGRVKKLVVLFEAKGLMKNLEDETSLISEVKAAAIEGNYKFTQGRMKKKLMGAKLALDAGIKEIFWGDSRVEKPITNALSKHGTYLH